MFVIFNIVNINSSRGCLHPNHPNSYLGRSTRRCGDVLKMKVEGNDNLLDNDKIFTPIPIANLIKETFMTYSKYSENLNYPLKG